MSTETETEAQPGSGGEAVAATVVDTPKPPRNDAEAAAQEAAVPPAPEPAAPKPEPPKKPNRTGEYIGRLQGENRELRNELEAIKRRLPPEPKPEAPRAEDFFQDPAAYTQRVAEHVTAQARAAWEQEQRQQAELRQQQEQLTHYQTRAQAFAAAHPDFLEVVESINPQYLPQELQAAIMAHERGAEIAYHLGNNEDDLFDLASRRPELMGAAVERLAQRLTAAPPEAPTPAAVVPPAPAVPPKPISQAPAPAPRVGGRSPTEVPPEKMTDDEWYRQDRERRRKR